MVDLKKVREQDFWYFVGYMVTDGHLSKDGRHLNITSKDRGHLFALRKALNLDVTIIRKGRGGSQKKYSVLQFGDVSLYRYLLSMGIKQQKTLSLGKAMIADSYFTDFLRGVIDGDGSIITWCHSSNGRRQWSLRIVSAAPDFAAWLLDYTEKYFGVRGRLHPQKRSAPHHTLYLIKFGKLAGKHILSRLYYPGALHLKRKRLMAERCIQDKNRMINYANVVRPGAETGKQARLKLE